MKKIITVHFTENGVPRAGLVPTIEFRELGTLLTESSIVALGNMTEVGYGWYRYDVASYDPTKNYIFNIDGGDVLGGGDRYKYGGNESYADDITLTVLDEPLISHTTTGSWADTVTKIKADTAAIMINEAGLASLLNTLLKYQRNRTKIDTTEATLTIYDDDCETPLTVFHLHDFHGMPSVQEVCERIPTTC